MHFEMHITAFRGLLEGDHVAANPATLNSRTRSRMGHQPLAPWPFYKTDNCTCRAAARSVLYRGGGAMPAPPRARGHGPRKANGLYVVVVGEGVRRPFLPSGALTQSVSQSDGTSRRFPPQIRLPW